MKTFQILSFHACNSLLDQASPHFSSEVTNFDRLWRLALMFSLFIFIGNLVGKYLKFNTP